MGTCKRMVVEIWGCRLVENPISFAPYGWYVGFMAGLVGCKPSTYRWAQFFDVYFVVGLGGRYFCLFCGQGIGGKFSASKLAPSISPGKSWEGVWGGSVGVLVLATVWVVSDGTWKSAVPSLYSQLFKQHWVILLIALLFLTAMSVVGDLVESLIKRSAGAKDSSNLLPGHGGVLDRIDALLPTLPIAMMLAGIVK